MSIFEFKRTFILALSIFFFVGLKAQSDYKPGYIITLQGDTIKGLVNYRGDAANAKDCVFKNEADQKKAIYLPSQIRSYRFIDGKYYISSNSINYKFKTPVFLEYIIKGLVSIYYYKDDVNDRYFTSKDTLVMELNHYVDVNSLPKDDNLAPTESQKFKGQLKYLIKDQPSLFGKVDGIVCNTKDLISLTKEYQKLSCPSQKCSQYEKKTGKDVKFKFGIFFSTGLSNLSTPPYDIYLNSYHLDFKTSPTYEIGATLNLNLNFLGENKFSIQLSPSLNFVDDYKSYIEESITPMLYSYKANINFTTLKIPLLFKYSFYSSSWPIIPFVKFGLGRSLYLNQKGTYEYSSVLLTGGEWTRSTVPLITSTVPKPRHYYFITEIGTDIKCGKSFFSVGATYEYGSSQLEGNRSDTQLQVGFQF